MRIIRHPQARGCNTTDRRDPCRAARNAVDKPWALEYEYAVPSHEQMPTGKDWNAKDEVYYIWGDTDFDTYGIHPRAMFPMSKYPPRSTLHFLALPLVLQPCLVQRLIRRRLPAGAGTSSTRSCRSFPWARAWLRPTR